MATHARFRVLIDVRRRSASYYSAIGRPVYTQRPFMTQGGEYERRLDSHRLSSDARIKDVIATIVKSLPCSIL